MIAMPKSSRRRQPTPAGLTRAAGAVSLWAMLLAAGLGIAQGQPVRPVLAPSPATRVAPATRPAPRQPLVESSLTGPASKPTGTAPTSGPATGPATGPAASRPATSMPTSKPAASRPAIRGPLLLNFRDASLSSVLDYLSEAAGMVVIQDTPVTGRVTLVSRQPVNIEEAVNLLDTVLRQTGYAAIRSNGRVLRIMTLEKAKRDLIPVQSGGDPEKIKTSDRMITQVVPIRFADAVKLKADLTPLIPSSADVASNASSNTIIITSSEAIVRRIVEIIKAIDVHMSETTAVKVFQLKYANATSAARLIQEIFRDDQAGGTGGGGPGGGRGGQRAFVFGGFPGMPGQGGADGGGPKAKVTASADDRTNTLVVSAAPDVLLVISGLVKELDSNPASEQAVFVYRVKNGVAANMANVLNNTFQSTGTSNSFGRTNQTGFGGTSSNNRSGIGTGSSGIGQGGNRTGGSGFSGNSIGGSRGGSSGTSGMARGGTSGTSGTAGRGGTSYGGGGSGFRPGGGTGMGMGQGTAGDLSGQVYVVSDDDTNSLLVTTASKNFERVKTIIEDLDRAVPQVLIKVLIAEVTHDKSVDLGVEFSGMNLRANGNGFKTGSNFGVKAQTDGFSFTLDEQNVTAAIHAIAKTSALDVLSRPYILTADNQQASIMVGQEVPFITNSRTTDTGQTINTIEYDDIGIILTVTPHINPQGLVTLDVAPEISTLTGQTVPISEGATAPVFAKRSAQARVAIRDGQTIVIGGLMEDRNTDTVDKVPILGDLPGGLGAIFRHTVTQKTKTELLIFLTPHVALMPDELTGMSKDELTGAKVIQNTVDPETFKDHLRGMDLGASTRPASTRPAWEKIRVSEPDTEPATEPASKPAVPPAGGSMTDEGEPK
jgi:general secretion pathway protein D